MSRLDRITLENKFPDGLSGATWTFMLLGEHLVVDSYAVWTQASKRHKPKITKHWSRLNSRESNLKQADVPFTLPIAEWAKKELLKQYDAHLTVGFQK